MAHIGRIFFLQFCSLNSLVFQIYCKYTSCKLSNTHKIRKGINNLFHRLETCLLVSFNMLSRMQSLEEIKK